MKIHLPFILLLTAFLPILAIGHNSDYNEEGKVIFSQNKGQWPKQVFFKTQTRNSNIWVEQQGLRIDLYKPEDLKNISHHRKINADDINNQQKVRRHNYYIKFKNTFPEPEILGEEKLNYFENYFLGKDKTKWASHVNTYKNIRYKSLYKGIDLKIYTHKGNLKWDFIVKAGNNPQQIELKYDGVDKINLKDEKLIISTSANIITELAPIAYQIADNGDTSYIKCKYVLKNNIVSFDFPENYDDTKTLIIDPTLIFASYSGSFADNWGFTATYDSKGYLYAGGIVFGSGYPTTIGAIDTTFNGVLDIGITKYDTLGTKLIYSTYMGGKEAEVPASLIVNSKDELLILGTTSSTDFPTTRFAYDSTFNGGVKTTTSSRLDFNNGSDLFVARFNVAGTQLLGSTYMGGSKNDGVNSSVSLINNYGDDIRGEIMVDKNDNIYIVSTTTSSDFPTTSGVFQSTKGFLNDGIIAKFDNSLLNLIWSSYFGGNGDDAIYGIKICSNEDIYITGGTNSNDLKTTNGVFKNTFSGGGADGYVANISNNGQRIKICTYIGTPSYDQSYLLDLDRYDNVYLFGQTEDTTKVFIKNSKWNSPKDGQFISKLTPRLDSMIWSTTWGNGLPGIDVAPSAFMTDLCNRVYLSAWGGEPNKTFAGGNTKGLPLTLNAMQFSTDGNDYYLMVMKDDASGIDYGSFYGGNLSDEHVDGGTSRFDNMGRIYQNVCAGCGGNDDFPTTLNSYSKVNNSSNCNNGVFKIDFNIPAIVADFIEPPVTCIPDTSFFKNNSFLTHPSLTTYKWDFGDGNSSTKKSPKHVYTKNGIYTVELIIFDPQSCNLSDTIEKQVVVLSGKTDTLQSSTVCLGESVQIGILPVSDTSVHFVWQPASSLSNPFISNPYASPTISTWYTMKMNTNTCDDIHRQYVEVLDLYANAGNDTTICESSIKLTGSGNAKNLKFHWSSNSSFSDTLNNYPYDSTLSFSYIKPTYLFFKISRANCSSYDSLFIDKRLYIFNSQVKNIKCHGDSTGSILVDITGGKTPYTYQWSNGQKTNHAINLAAGYHKLIITDNDGCTTSYDTVLTQADKLESTSKAIGNPCKDVCIGQAFSSPTGGTAPYSWQWDDTNSQTTNPATKLCSGTYHVTITDNNNCTLFDTIIISDSATFVLNSFGNNIPCQDACIGKAYSNPSGGTTPYHWQWNDSNNQKGNPAISLCEGIYHVTVTDANNCILTDTVEIIDTSTNVNFIAWADTDSILEGSKVRLHCSILGNNFKYTWEPANSLSDPNSTSPIAEPKVTTTYHVTAKDPYGCIWTSTITIYVKDVICDEPFIYVPNAFTPNNDGQNDILYVFSSVGYDIEFMIYDRWGEKVFESKDINKGWDGKYNNKELQPGVYVYHLKLKCFNHETFIKKGNITLIR